MVSDSNSKQSHGCGRPSFGWPSVFAVEGWGPAIEDVWPSLYIGADRVDEMARKIRQLPWASAVLELWREEAEIVLGEKPDFDQGEVGGRCGMHIFDQGDHLVFDPRQCQRFYNPHTKEFTEPDEKGCRAWVVLCHERIRRLMTSLGFLYRLTGDKRYSRWVWDGLRASVSQLYGDVTAPPADWKRERAYTVVYGGLYESQCMLQLLQSFQLVQDAPGGSEKDVAAVNGTIFETVGEMLSRWMDVMIVHNMSCWTMATLALLGRHLGREDWLEKALYSERAGLQVLLKRGLPRDPKTGKPDGFWHETSTFYNFYAGIPLSALYRVGEEEGALDDDLRERFRSFFGAPLQLVDPELNLLSVGDRVGPARLSLTQFRHVYEYAAGQVDPERYGPVLSMLYKTCGAPRTSLAALAWGPDELPPPCEPPRESAILGAARMVTFRRDTERGNVTLWFLGGEENNSGQAHHHHDKLSVSLHAFGEVVSSDLGLPGFSDNDWSTFLEGTLAHNTLLADEADQGPMESLLFEADVEAPVPWARSIVRGNRDDNRGSLWKTMVNRGDEVREGVYDGVTLERAVFFDPPYVVLSDHCEAPEQKRFGFAFHGCGQMVASVLDAEEASPLGLLALRTDGAYGLFEGRTCADPVRQLVADWRVRTNLWLRLVAVSDGPMEATWGRTPGNPRREIRGTVLLRAPGNCRRFFTALELHRGTPTLAGVGTSDGEQVSARLFDGTERTYRVP